MNGIMIYGLRLGVILAPDAIPPFTLIYTYIYIYMYVCMYVCMYIFHISIF